MMMDPSLVKGLTRLVQILSLHLTALLSPNTSHVPVRCNGNSYYRNFSMQCILTVSDVNYSLEYTIIEFLTKPYVETNVGVIA